MYVCMCVCMYVCKYVCMNVYVCMYVCACMHVCMHVCMCVNICMHAYLHACMYVRMYCVLFLLYCILYCMHVCMYVCMLLLQPRRADDMSCSLLLRLARAQLQILAISSGALSRGVPTWVLRRRIDQAPLHRDCRVAACSPVRPHSTRFTDTRRLTDVAVHPARSWCPSISFLCFFLVRTAVHPTRSWCPSLLIATFLYYGSPRQCRGAQSDLLGLACFDALLR